LAAQGPPPISPSPRLAPSNALTRAAHWLTQKLARVTSSREFIPEIDGLRFVALIPVLILHSTTHFLIWRGRTGFDGNWTAGHGLILRAISVGAFGVQIFFVISGFVVALPFARHAIAKAPKPALGRYFMRRLTRIEPPYILSLIATYLLWRNFRGYLPDLLAGLVYMHQFVFAIGNPINIATWTLEIEVCFYLLAPWLTCLYFVPNRLFRWPLQLALIAAYNYFILAWLIHHCPPRLNNTLLTELPYFLAGILLADLYVSGMVQISGVVQASGAISRAHAPLSRKLAWDIAALAAAALLIDCCTENYRFFWTAPILLLLCFLGAMQGLLLSAFLRFRPITLIGGMCYSAYLWHTAMLVLLRPFIARLVPHQLADGPAALVFCLLMVPILILFTAPIYYFLEKPFMNGPGSRAIERALRPAPHEQPTAT
jgi:peptidoglycan/LPS O-acetylase OafA/YrhL